MEVSEGYGWENVNDMILDAEENMILIGNYNGDTKFAGYNDKGSEDVFIVCFDKEGNFLWRNSINNEDYCYVSSILAVGNNGYCVTGFFRGKLNIGSFTLNAENKIDAFVAQLNNQGQASWLKPIKGDFKGDQILMGTINSNEFVLACNFKGSLKTGDTIYRSIPGTSDIIALLFDNNGEILKVRHIQGTGNDCVNDLTVDKNSTIYLGISFEKELLLSPYSIKSKGKSDGAIISLDSTLNLTSIIQFGGSSKDKIECTKLDRDENLIVSGIYSDEFSLGEMILPQPKGKNDIFVCKIDKTGKIKWTESFGGEGSEFISSMAINKNNFIYLSGNFRGEIVPGDQKFQSAGSLSDYYIARIETNGKLKFIEAFSDTLCDFTRKIMIDNENNIYLTGNLQKLHKDDKDTVPNDLESDFFLAKLYDCDFRKKIRLGNDTCLCGDSFTIKADSTFKEYLWNDGTNDYIKVVDTTGLYYVTAINDHNCSSSDSIFIKLNPLPEFDLGDTIVVNKGETITLYGPTGMKAYRWSDNSTLFFLDVSTDKMNEGLYQYGLEVTNKNDCKAKAVVFVSVINDKNILIQHYSDDLIKDLTVVVFPNPANDQVFLRLQGLILGENIRIGIYTTGGDLVMEEYIKASALDQTVILNTYTLKNGSYFIFIYHYGVIIKKKFIIV